MLIPEMRTWGWGIACLRIMVEQLRFNSVWAVAYSPNRRNIISGSGDNTIRIWDVDTGSAVGQPLKGQTSWVWSTSYSPNGCQIISGNHDNTIVV